jgi:hypothetical protein
MTWTVETLNDTVDAKVRLVLAPFGDANFLTELSALPNDMKAKFVWISKAALE